MRPATVASRPARSSRSALFAVLAVTIVVMALVGGRPPPSASADPGDEAAFVTAINQIRGGLGLPPLAGNNELVGLARAHAQVMADAGNIFHASPISAGYTGPWAKFGENVGVGTGVQDLVDAFVASPGHYANIIDPAFDQIGVGVVRSNGSLYTTHRFLQTGAPAATPPPPPPPAPAPAPETTAAPPPPQPAAVPTAEPPQPPTETPPPTTTAAPTVSVPPVTAERMASLLGLLELVGT